jgi:polyisoprenoid-binding protein YceI
LFFEVISMRLERWLVAGVCLVGVLLLAGCESKPTASSSPAAPTITQGTPVAPGTPAPAGGNPALHGRIGGGGPPTDVLPPVDTVPVPIKEGIAALGPENSTVQFVGSHTDKSKSDHVGGFEKFTGQIKADAAAKTIESVNVDIETESLFTAIPKLTDHLKNPDFLNAPEHPKITFASKTVTPESGNANQVQIVGDLTMHGTTKEVTIPATVEFSDQGLVLRSEFKIDRTEFGMDLMTDGVEKEVKLTVVVGEKTRRPITADQAVPGAGAQQSRPLVQ